MEGDFLMFTIIGSLIVCTKDDVTCRINLIHSAKDCDGNLDRDA